MRTGFATMIRSATFVLLLSTMPSCTLLTGGDVFMTLEVAETRALCMGVGPMECLLVRRAPGGELELFYDHITDFEYEPGYRYRLRVLRTRVKDPPADGSSFDYRLLRVDSKEPSPRLEMLERTRAAEAQWLEARPVAYTMVLERVCFCAPDALGPVRLEVTRLEGDWVGWYEWVVSQQYVDDGQPVPFELRPYFPSAQGLFNRIRLAIAQDAHFIDVEFDDVAGYPTRVFVDRDAGLADDEVEYVVHSLEAG